MLSLLLLLLTLLQVWDGLTKFLGRRTTVVAATEDLQRTELPDVSFCPGYRDETADYVEQVDRLHEFMDGADDHGEEQNTGYFTCAKTTVPVSEVKEQLSLVGLGNHSGLPDAVSRWSIQI